MDHIEETLLEQYSMGSLDDEAAAEVEQHLLMCKDCCARVTEADDYTRAMKSAAQKLPAVTERARWNFRLLIPAFAACVLLIVAAVNRFSDSSGRSPVTVALFAMRGANTQTLAPARRPLVLQPDLNGLPAAPTYRLDLVNTSGSPVWQGILPAQPQPAHAVVPAQSHGVYFVRVSLLSGELLREYALELRGHD